MRRELFFNRARAESESTKALLVHWYCALDTNRLVRLRFCSQNENGVGTRIVSRICFLYGTREGKGSQLSASCLLMVFGPDRDP